MVWFAVTFLLGSEYAGPFILSDHFSRISPYYITCMWKEIQFWKKFWLCVNFFFIPAALLLMGMIAWLVYVTDPWAVSYSFGFSVIALVLVAISGILLIPDVDENNSYRICADCTTSGPSDRTKTRSVSPDMSTGRSLSRNDRTTPLNSRSEYDQMPRPMLTPVEKTGSANQNLRPATFNNISSVTLQRDRAGY